MRYIGRIALRHVIWILVGLAVYVALSVFGVAHAQAPTSPCKVSSYNNYPATCDQAMAYDAAVADYDYWLAQGYTSNGGVISLVAPAGKSSYAVHMYLPSGSPVSHQYFNAGSPCSNGGVWDDVSHTCFDAAVCLAKEPIQSAYVTAITSSTCVDGCEFQAPGDSVSVTFPDLPGSPSISNVSGWTPTGSACAAGAPAPTASKPQECVLASDGQTFCLKADGSHCASASTGRQICWRPGETGEKADGPVLQVRQAGQTPQPPVTPPPPGDTLVAGPTHVATTNVGPTTITTNTTNYTTTQGTDAAPANDGESGDGSGAPEGAPDPKNAASGGAGCDAPPVYTGDPVLGNILIQSWRNRCNANGNKLTAGACGENGAVGAFECSNDEILCKIALVAQEKKCSDEYAVSQLHADAIAGDAFAEEEGISIFQEEGEGMELDGSRVQLAGGSLLPDFTLEGLQFTPPPEFDATIDLVKAILIGAFTLLAMLIAGGSRET